MTMRTLNMSGHTQVNAQLAMDMDIPEAARLQRLDAIARWC